MHPFNHYNILSLYGLSLSINFNPFRRSCRSSSHQPGRYASKAIYEANYAHILTARPLYGYLEKSYEAEPCPKEYGV